MRNSTRFLGIGALLIGLLAASGAYAQHHDDGDGHAKGNKAEAKLPLCPVMGKAIDFGMSTKTDDGPVYFCCKMCIKKYGKNPEKFAEKVSAQREMLAKTARVQVSCPLSGEPIDKKVFVETDGKKVYLCCNDCKPKYAASPKKYAGKLAASYTYQTQCPIMDEEIDPTSYGDLPSGQRIYYCCDGCDEKFQKDPKKYAAKLAEQGIKLKVK